MGKTRTVFSVEQKYFGRSINIQGGLKLIFFNQMPVRNVNIQES
jgi:hypothetical protein